MTDERYREMMFAAYDHLVSGAILSGLQRELQEEMSAVALKVRDLARKAVAAGVASAN